MGNENTKSHKTMYGGWRLPNARKSRRLVTWWHGSRQPKPRWTAVVTTMVLSSRNSLSG